MKIAIAAEGKSVSQHFGHCEGFQIFTVEGDKILKSEFVQNPGHEPGVLPVFLSGLGVHIVISGGMGGRAQELFMQNSIKVITGASGDFDQTIAFYLSGQLESSDSVCSEHQHAGDCGNH